jgi:ATP-dependent metalloprotease FtsH
MLFPISNQAKGAKMFIDKAQAIIDLAKDCAFARLKEVLDIESLLAAVGSDAEAGVRFAECLTNGDVPKLRAKCPDLGQPAPCPGKLDLAESFHEIIVTAAELASGDGVPHRIHPGLIDVPHLVCSIAISREACRLLGNVPPLSYDDALRILASWYDEAESSISIADLVSKLRGLRAELLTKVFGQDHAINTFIEGLYNSEVTAAADKERRRPSAVFVFAGPPGVGKTYMTELCASFLGRPFKRFDMTGYSDHQAQSQLVGFAPSYKDAHAGLLTGFVEKNPNAILLFDEIEKAHLNTIQLFYQILDAGRLEDKFTEHDVNFRDVIIIFTTNAGRSLYDNPNKIGISAANSSYHKRTIMSALENEKNATTGQPAFPQPICSRLSQGYPVLFNHLGINELERVCAAEITRVESLLERQYYKHINHSSLLPISLVLREGGNVDARQLRAEAEKFIKQELFKYSSLYTEDRLEDAFEKFDKIRFELKETAKDQDPIIQNLFHSTEKPKILLVSNNQFVSLCLEHIPEIQWISASSANEVIDMVSTEDIDMVLLDIWIRRDMSLSLSHLSLTDSDSHHSTGTIDQEMDFIPLSARALDEGREILRKIHERSPQTPVYLLSFADALMEEQDSSLFESQQKRRPIDDELFLACVRAGGARGLVPTSFSGIDSADWNKHRKQFTDSLLEISHHLYLEKKAHSLAKERKVLSFETAAELNKEKRQLTIRIRNLSLARAIDALDAGEMVDDIERPNVRFEDVYGAKSAKESLQFVIDWLRNPKKYSAMGIRPPKGILLTGPPGTGKTMLARAVAGESDCAFIEKSASSFVTVWQGSGPQNVRNLFERARRYAPAVIFIDEIDAIGVSRSGGTGAGRSQEEALNAMLTEMDGFRSQTQFPVIVLAATNLAESLDDALKRRFDRSIDVDKPDKESRLKYLENNILKRKNSEVTKKTIDRLAGQTAGQTIADIERIIHSAAIMAAQSGIVITDAILEEAFEKFRMGEARETPDKDTLKRVARHESGHTLIAWLGNNPPVQVTIVGRANAGGFMERVADENRMIYTKADIEQQICEAMGGRAAEILYYGKEGGLSTGVSGDLKNATHWASRMVREFGMDDKFGQVALQGHSSRSAQDGPLTLKVTSAVEKIVAHQLEQAIRILTENREYLDKLSTELLEKNRLTKHELELMLPPLKKPAGD